MQHPIAILGAGPVGLAAAAHAVKRGLDFVLLEQAAVGAAMLQWGHVRLFSPWRYSVDAAARALLEQKLAFCANAIGECSLPPLIDHRPYH